MLCTTAGVVLTRRQKRNVHPTDSGARKMTTLAAQCVVTNKQLGKKLRIMAQNLPASLSAGTPTEPWTSSSPGGNIRCYSLLDGVYLFLYVILSFIFILMFVSECFEKNGQHCIRAFSLIHVGDCFWKQKTNK